MNYLTMRTNLVIDCVTIKIQTVVLATIKLEYVNSAITDMNFKIIDADWKIAKLLIVIYA